MRRREFITLAGGAVAAWPVVGRGQPSTLPVIGYLNAPEETDYAGSFVAGLQSRGLVLGRDFRLEIRNWYASTEIAPLVHELLALPASLLVVGGTLAAQIAKKEGTSIPVLFRTGGDPVRSGLVESLSRPGGNLTGISSMGGSLNAKRLEFLDALIAKGERIGILMNGENPNHKLELRETEFGARLLARSTLAVQASQPPEIAMAIAKLTAEQVRALVVFTDGVLNGQADRIAKLCLQNNVAAIFGVSYATRAGGLISYNLSLDDLYRQLGDYAARMIKGARPADLPVVLPTRFNLMINLKTAKALGLTVPQSLLAIADEVIE